MQQALIDVPPSARPRVGPVWLALVMPHMTSLCIARTPFGLLGLLGEPLLARIPGGPSKLDLRSPVRRQHWRSARRRSPGSIRSGRPWWAVQLGKRSLVGESLRRCSL